MGENHIHRITRERDEAEQQLDDIRTLLREAEDYLLSRKFWNDDYVHVRTDMLPKIAAFRFAALPLRS